MNALVSKVHQATIPSSYLAVCGDLTDMLFSNKFSDLNSFTVSSSNSVSHLTVLSNGISSSPQDSFTRYDRYVHDAILSIFEITQSVDFSPQMVLNALSGKFYKRNHAEVTNAKIIESIKRLSSIEIEINVLSKNGAVIYHAKGPLLLLTYSVREIRGLSTPVFKFSSPPLLLEYAKANKKLLYIPSKLLNIDNSVGIHLYLVIQYLLRKIALMKIDDDCSHLIAIDDVYRYIWPHTLDKIADNGHSLSRVRDYLKKALEYWKEQQYINNYRIIRVDHKYAMIEILLSSQLPVTEIVQKNHTVFVPKQIIDRLALQPGDVVCFSENKKGEIIISKEIPS